MRKTINYYSHLIPSKFILFLIFSFVYLAIIITLIFYFPIISFGRNNDISGKTVKRKTPMNQDKRKG